MSAVSDSLVVAGLTPMTTLDYPDHLACVVFTQGCPLRCGYCHNPQMLPRTPQADAPDWPQVRHFLEKRCGLLQAVVFSGGEPTAQAALLPAVDEVQAMGFKVALHTSGINPSRLEKLLPQLSWVGLDIKATPADYTRICGREGVANKASSSLQLLLESEVELEVRTTLHPLDFNETNLQQLLQWLQQQGVKRLVLQLARGGQCLNNQYARLPQPFTATQLEPLLQTFRPAFESLQLR